MARKGSKSSEGSPTEKNEKSGRKFRNQFWTSHAKKEEKTVEDPSKRPESSISRQFMPKKQQGVSEAWSKQSQESRDDQSQPFNYTPFKSGTLNRPPSANGMRGPTPTIGQTILQPQTLAQQPGMNRVQQPPQGQMKPQYMPQFTPNPYQIYGIATNPKDTQPQGQSTPKLAPQHVVRQQEKAQVPPGPYRPASVMNTPAMPRPHSRANSEIGVGMVGGGMGSRYQSYCTLPRPEQLDFDQGSVYGSEISHMAQQINMLYGSFHAKPVSEVQPVYVHNQPPNNRPASQMLAGAPGMASDFIHPQQSMYDAEPAVSRPETEAEILKPAKDIVYFDALSLLSVFQVLCAIVIFTCGVLRLIWHAKWAIGIELAFAIFVFIAGSLGIYANSKRCHCAAMAAFVMSTFASLIALVPLVLGLFPTIPLTFPSADADLFINEDESRIVDYLLSFACFAEVIVSLITSIYGCQSIGSTMTHVEKLRLNADMNTAFESSSTSLPKSADTGREKKAPLH